MLTQPERRFSSMWEQCKLVLHTHLAFWIQINLLLLQIHMALIKPILQWSAHWLRKAWMEKILMMLSMCSRNSYPLRATFPLLVKFIQLPLTIAVSTAQCERSFFALKRIKSYLWSTMAQDQLVGLAILSIEKDISKDLSLDKVVDQFASRDKNRRIITILLT